MQLPQSGVPVFELGDDFLAFAEDAGSELEDAVLRATATDTLVYPFDKFGVQFFDSGAPHIIVAAQILGDRTEIIAGNLAGQKGVTEIVPTRDFLLWTPEKPLDALEPLKCFNCANDAEAAHAIGRAAPMVRRLLIAFLALCNMPGSVSVTQAPYDNKYVEKRKAAGKPVKVPPFVVRITLPSGVERKIAISRVTRKGFVTSPHNRRAHVRRVKDRIVPVRAAQVKGGALIPVTYKTKVGKFAANL